MEHPIVLTIRETAARAGLPVHFVRRMVDEKLVHAVRSGKKYYVSWASVERYLMGEGEAS